jgi:hypothetical protein
MIRGPRRVSAAVIKSIRAMLKLTMRFGVQFRRIEPRGDLGTDRKPSAPKGSLFCSSSDHDMTDLG